MAALSASHNLAADSTRVSSTAWRSNVDRLMTLSTSAVAVCCSKESRSSFSRRALGIGNIHDPAIEHRGAGHVVVREGNWKSQSYCFGIAGIGCADGHRLQHISIRQGDHDRGARKELQRTGYDGVEYRLRVGE